jgi:glycosyltransferase involved in cell wall biosynthesis
MRISVITINYNNGVGLRSTIDSVVGQKCNDFEYIVIDGGSTDSSLNVIKEYSHKIDYWVSEPDGGIYNAMNKGVAHAHGDYCIFLNSGDCFYNDVVLNHFMDYNATEDIVVGKLISQKNKKILFPSPQILSLYYLYSGTIPHQSSFIRTELLRLYPYDECLKIVSDWKFFVQTLIMDNGSIRYLDTFVARYDMEGLSSVNPKLMREEKEAVMAMMFPSRVLADYQNMKASECLTQTITPQLRQHYGIDQWLYRFGNMMLKLVKK